MTIKSESKTDLDRIAADLFTELKRGLKKRRQQMFQWVDLSDQGVHAADPDYDESLGVLAERLGCSRQEASEFVAAILTIMLKGKMT